MAKIEMDLSEYQEIQKNKELLEKSLNRERRLNHQIKELKQQQIDSLKDNAKKVTIVERSEVFETRYVTRPFNTVYPALERLLHQALRNREILNDPNFRSVDEDYIALMDAVFKKTESESIPQETITYQGLDEVEKKMRSDYKERMDKETKSKVKKYDEISTELQEAHKKIITLKRDISLRETERVDLMAELKVSQIYKLETESLISDMADDVLNKINVFNFKAYRENMVYIYTKFNNINNTVDKIIKLK